MTQNVLRVFSRRQILVRSAGLNCQLIIQTMRNLKRTKWVISSFPAFVTFAASSAEFRFCLVGATETEGTPSGGLARSHVYVIHCCLKAWRNILNSRRYYQIKTSRFDLVGSKFERSEMLIYILKKLLNKTLFFITEVWKDILTMFFFNLIFWSLSQQLHWTYLKKLNWWISTHQKNPIFLHSL